MQRIELDENISFSSVIQGYWRILDWKQSPSETLRFLHEGLERGITTTDHADIYGNYEAEAAFGAALAQEPSIREKIEIVTKCGIELVSKNRPENTIHAYNTTKEHVITSAERSLKNFNTDYIDVLLIHRPDPFMDPGDIADAFDLLHKEGKVRAFGVSNHRPHELSLIQSRCNVPIVTNQIEVSPLALHHFEDGAIHKGQQDRMPMMIWSPLSGGRLFSDDTTQAVRVREVLEGIAKREGYGGVDEAAYAWLAAHPASFCPIVGSGKIKRVERAITAMEKPMSRGDWFAVFQASMGHDIP
ncbi:aldo/keto reductase [Bacillus fonticola]|uniref:aldo/keto reductase n=1 Tax=Bacillus fonticola TaxID=2728853 RepID=UPI00147497C9|nr:aldo/keto reductase [Bacillus fonticola]